MAPNTRHQLRIITLGPQTFATEQACISAGESKTYMGRQIKFVCKRVER